MQQVAASEVGVASGLHCLSCYLGDAPAPLAVEDSQRVWDVCVALPLTRERVSGPALGLCLARLYEGAPTTLSLAALLAEGVASPGLRCAALAAVKECQRPDLPLPMDEVLACLSSPGDLVGLDCEVSCRHRPRC